MVLLKKLLNSWFDEKMFQWEQIFHNAPEIVRTTVNFHWIFVKKNSYKKIAPQPLMYHMATPDKQSILGAS